MLTRTTSISAILALTGCFAPNSATNGEESATEATGGVSSTTNVPPPGSTDGGTVASTTGTVGSSGSATGGEIGSSGGDTGGSTQASTSTLSEGTSSSGEGTESADASSSSSESTGTPLDCEEWSVATASSAMDDAEGIAVAGDGTVHVAGFTEGALAPNPFGGGRDIFVAKHDADGAQEWIVQIGSTSGDQAEGVAVDAGGNVYYAGDTVGAVNGQINIGGRDALLGKLSSDGDILWTRQFGTATSDRAYGLAVTDGGDAFVVGVSSGPFAGPNETSAATLVRFDPDGSEVWRRQLESPEGATGYAVAVRNSLVYVVGISEGFDDDAGAGLDDIFVAKYTSAGTLLWTELIGTAENDRAYGVVVDDAENVYAVGSARGGLEGNMALGQDDAVLVKLDSDGALVWAAQFGSSANDVANATAFDADGNILVAGRTQGNFDGNTLIGNNDAFVARFDPDGNLLESRLVGTVDFDAAVGVAGGGSNDAFIAGASTGDIAGPNQGGSDVFAMRLCLD